MSVHIQRSTDNHQRPSYPIPWQEYLETQYLETPATPLRRQIYRQPFKSKFLVTLLVVTSCVFMSSMRSTAAFISDRKLTKTMFIPTTRTISSDYQSDLYCGNVITLATQRLPISTHNTKAATAASRTSTQLLFGKKLNGDKSSTSSNIDVDGMATAPYIFSIVLLLCVWNFTIPTEFRRARICSEQQVIDYPNSNCKTWSQYVSGIQNYYNNGGTLLKFDFSIDKENNIWITGPQEIIE